MSKRAASPKAPLPRPKAGTTASAFLRQLEAMQRLLIENPALGVPYVAHYYGVALRPLSRLELEISQRMQAEQERDLARIRQEIADFRADTSAHPHFEAVQPLMAGLLQKNAVITLQQAYELACAKAGYE